MKRFLLVGLLLTTPAVAQTQVPTIEQRTSELCGSDLGSLHVRVLQLVAQNEALQRENAAGKAKIKEMETKPAADAPDDGPTPESKARMLEGRRKMQMQKSPEP